MARLTRSHAAYAQIYGALMLDPTSALAKIGSAGRPPLLVDIRIVAPEETEVGAGEAGELLVRGPNVMAGIPSGTHVGDLRRSTSEKLRRKAGACAAPRPNHGRPDGLGEARATPRRQTKTRTSGRT